MAILAMRCFGWHPSPEDLATSRRSGAPLSLWLLAVYNRITVGFSCGSRDPGLAMKLFISFSGERSKAVATALKTWIKVTFADIEPWMSHDIGKGTRWSKELEDALRESCGGIVCLTPENLDSQWLVYEAGWLRGSSRCAFVAPFLTCGLERSQVLEPLAALQYACSTKDDTKKLFHQLNSMAVSRGVECLMDPRALDERFEAIWGNLESQLRTIEAIDDDR